MLLTFYLPTYSARTPCQRSYCMTPCYAMSSEQCYTLGRQAHSPSYGAQCLQFQIQSPYQVKPNQVQTIILQSYFS